MGLRVGVRGFEVGLGCLFFQSLDELGVWGDSLGLVLVLVFGGWGGGKEEGKWKGGGRGRGRKLEMWDLGEWGREGGRGRDLNCILHCICIARRMGRKGLSKIGMGWDGMGWDGDI